MAQCKGSTTMFCDFNIALTASASPNCLSAIFTDFCEFRFKTNVLPTAMFELSPSHLLLYKTTLLALDCAKGQQILTGCFFCVVKIPCRCSVTANNLYLPPRLGKCNNNTEDITILHPVNLALLQLLAFHHFRSYHFWRICAHPATKFSHFQSLLFAILSQW